MHKVWSNEPHDTEPLAWREKSKQGQRAKEAQKSIILIGRKKEQGEQRRKKAPASANVLEIVDE